MGYKITLLLAVSLSLGSLGFACEAYGAEDVIILHTNDLHSHFKPEPGAPGLGGIARLKTLVDRLRVEVPSTLLVDGGDWSEGHVYYNLGAGAETLRMMDHLGYDAAVVGNHDWLNGPDVLLDAIGAAKPRMALLGANLSPGGYSRAQDFNDKIKPYSLFKVGSWKIAVIGLSTFELIYDKFMKPVKILSPFSIARDLSRRLKISGEADFVLALSHNGIGMNEQILKAAPELDLVIGAHDHKKLIEPLRVARPLTQEGWVVETGKWGEFLGRVDLRVQNGRLSLANYRLYQIDASIPENDETASLLDDLEREIEKIDGPLFHDHVTESQITFSREGLENLIGNAVTDAYLDFSGADLSIDQTAFIYSTIHAGDVRGVDVYNAMPAVFNPKTRKSWTLNTFEMTGKSIRSIFSLLLASEQLAQLGILNASGIEVVFDPAFKEKALLFPIHSGLESLVALTMPGNVIRSLQVGGQELDPERAYKIAASTAILETIDFINSTIPNLIRVKKLRDTGVEGWKLFAHALRSQVRIDARSYEVGNRLVPFASDIAVLDQHMSRYPSNDSKSRIRAVVKNMGSLPTPPLRYRVECLFDAKANDLTGAPDWKLLATSEHLPSIAPHDEMDLEWSIETPTRAGSFPLLIQVKGAEQEPITANNQVVHWF